MSKVKCASVSEPMSNVKCQMLTVRSKGFTLIELLLYSLIVCLVLFVFTLSLWQIIEGNIKANVSGEVSRSGNFAMTKIIRAIRNASGIVQPATAGQVSFSLELTMQDSVKSPTKFATTEGKITMQEAVNPAYPLTGENVQIVELKFTNLSYINTPGTIKIEMLLAHFNPGGRPEYGASITLTSTASLSVD